LVLLFANIEVMTVGVMLLNFWGSCLVSPYRDRCPVVRSSFSFLSQTTTATTDLSLFPPTWFPIQSYSLTGRLTTYLFLDDC